MTTLATVQADYNTLRGSLNGLLNTAIGGLNPNKVTTPQIIALINDTIIKLDVLYNTTAAQAQALGVT